MATRTTNKDDIISHLKKIFPEYLIPDSDLKKGREVFNSNLQKTVAIINSLEEGSFTKQVYDISGRVFSNLPDVSFFKSLKGKVHGLRQETQAKETHSREKLQEHLNGLLEQISKDIFRMDISVDGRPLSKEAQEVYTYLREKLFDNLFGKAHENICENALIGNLVTATKEIEVEAEKEHASSILKYIVRHIVEPYLSKLDTVNLYLKDPTNSYKALKSQLDEFTGINGTIGKEIAQYQTRQLFEKVLAAFKGNTLEATKFC